MLCQGALEVFMIGDIIEYNKIVRFRDYSLCQERFELRIENLEL